MGAEPGSGHEPEEADLAQEPTQVIDVVGAEDSDASSSGVTQVGTPEELAEAYGAVEAFLLGSEPTLTRVEVAARAGVPLALAEQLWKWLGFPHASDDDVAFGESDVEALQMTSDLMRMGILSEDSQAALVRTWGRSYARLAEWQTSLLAGLAIEGPDPDLRMTELAAGVLPRVEALQSYVWRRHLASAASRLMSTSGAGEAPELPMSVCFVDIVGYTSQSKNLDDHDLVEMVELFEQVATDAVVEGGGRVIKTIGDEILFAADDAGAATDIAMALTGRGEDADDPFPAVRAGLAHGPVVARLGDVFGPTVNIASRLTSVARPGTVVVDRGAHDALTEPPDAPDPEGDDLNEGDDLSEGEELADIEATYIEAAEAVADDEADTAGDTASDLAGEDRAHTQRPTYRLKRLRRVSVKGYSRLEAWSVNHHRRS